MGVFILVHLELKPVLCPTLSSFMTRGGDARWLQRRCCTWQRSSEGGEALLPKMLPTWVNPVAMLLPNIWKLPAQESSFVNQLLICLRVNVPVNPIQTWSFYPREIACQYQDGSHSQNFRKLISCLRCHRVHILHQQGCAARKTAFAESMDAWDMKEQLRSVPLQALSVS